MTLLMNHRYYSYNIPTNRNKNTKKVIEKRPRKSSPFFKRKENNVLKISNLLTVVEEKIVPTTPPSSPVLPIPSAPPAIFTNRSVYVNGAEYIVEIPEDFDIYEGLRRWYPSLYHAVLEEENEIRYETELMNQNEDIITEEDYEAAINHMDYLEWLYD